MLSVALLGALATPAGAVAAPLGDAAQLTRPAVQVVGEQVRAVAPDAGQTVEQSVAPVRSAVDAAETAEPVRSTLDAVKRSEPVRSTVDTVAAAGPVRAAVDAVGARVAPQATPAVAVGEARDESQRAAVRAPARERPSSAGGIDRATRRRGGPAAGVGEVVASSGFATAVLSPANLLGTIAAGELPRAAASSIAASGDDGGDGGSPLFGHGGGSDALGGPGGLALIALGLLVALLTLIPRFSSRLLQTSPTRWGRAAFHVPVERPG